MRKKCQLSEAYRYSRSSSSGMMDRRTAGALGAAQDHKLDHAAPGHADDENLSRVRTAGGSSSRSRRCSRTRCLVARQPLPDPAAHRRRRRADARGALLAAVHAAGGRRAAPRAPPPRAPRAARRAECRAATRAPRASAAAPRRAAAPPCRSAGRRDRRRAAPRRAGRRCSDSWTIRSTASSYRRVPPGVPPGVSDSAPSECSLWECSFCRSRASGESADPLGASAPPLGASFSDAVESSADVATVSSLSPLMKNCWQPARRVWTVSRGLQKFCEVDRPRELASLRFYRRSAGAYTFRSLGGLSGGGS